MKNKVLKYEKNFRIWLFICINDVSFINNMLNHKSFQNYIMLLFEKSITWKINKQNIIITSSTETELLALSQIIKKTIFISYFLKILILRFDKLLIIECDNKQILKLIIKNSIKLSTKLQHVNIHNYWLWQEHSEQKILFN